MTSTSNAVILVIGIIVMATALIRAIGFESIRLTPRSRHAWIILLALMLLFICGYAMALVMVLRGQLQFLSAITSLIFALGAIFVLFTVDFALNNLKTLTTFSQSLERQTEQLITQTKQLEKSNRHLELEFAERSKADLALKKANEDLTVARDQALEGSLAKTQFLMNMSHELRTPLNHILGYSDMVREEVEEENPELVGDIQKLQGAAKHLLSLIDEILRISQIETGKMQLTLENFEIQGLVQEVVSGMQPHWKTNGNVFEFSGIENAGSMISDAAKLRQILFNLLNNANKFTENGKVRLEVERENKEGDEWVEFRVGDTGAGIHPTQLGKLFQPFQQADNALSRKYGGTGLGLAISRHYCAMLGGTIEVVSEQGKGSLFTVAIPAEIYDPELESV